MDNTDKEALAFQKAKEGLWNSLQTHLIKLYDAENNFIKCLTFAETFPFNPKLVEEEKLGDYWLYRNALKDIFIDETDQLSNLIKAIRKKAYKEEDKKQLFIMILGYLDIAGSIFSNLDTYKSTSPIEAELTDNQIKFEKLRNFVRLNIRGIIPKT